MSRTAKDVLYWIAVYQPLAVQFASYELSQNTLGLQVDKEYIYEQLVLKP
jgi:hypothetical protein